MISYEQFGFRNHAHKHDWYRTRAEAVEHAEEMRQRKIASLEKQIKKLKALRFR